MARLFEVRKTHRGLIALVVGGGLVIYAACNTSSVPELVSGPAVSGNERPSLTITQPSSNLSVAQSGTFTISWTDQDRDSSAMISFVLVNIDVNASPASVSLVQGIPENDTAAADSITVTTNFVARGSYYLQGIIDDGVNAPVVTYATTLPPASTRIVITVGESDVTPTNRPPSIYVSQPQANLSVTLDDTIIILVQPTSAPPDASLPYDADNSAQLYLSLDLDDDPLTGNPQSPDPAQIIALLDNPITIPQGNFAALDPIRISVDLARFPLREDGKPYFIRATITDGVNEPRNAYATGTVNVTRFATGIVDLGKVGRTLTGATWLGFDPGARLGTAMTSVGNFDATPTTDTQTGDAVDDFMLVAQLGTPTGLKAMGEAYLVYGTAGTRFGGRINVNTVGTEVDGATFMGPEPRISDETNGITAVGFVPDLTGDGRPELLFGCSYVDGIRTTRDDDPGDSSDSSRESVVAKIQQGNLQVFQLTLSGDEKPDPEFETQAYDGVVDTLVDLNNPNSSADGTAETLSWSGTAPANGQFTPTKWALIEFNDLQSSIPDFASLRKTDIGIVSATLFIDVFARGSDGEVHALLNSITNNTTLNSFSGGQPPVADNQYKQETVNSFQEIITGENSVDVTTTVTDIFANKQDIYGWIVIPTDVISVTFASSDYTFVDVRPRLEIRYTRPVPTGSSNDGCYPDFMPNNTSNNPTKQGSQDDVIATRGNLEQLGVAMMVNSENRDENGIVDANRLNRATVSLDLAGMRPVTDDGFPHIVPRRGAENPASGRLDGCRFQPAMFDIIDAQKLNQGPIRAEFGSRVAWIPDINNDQTPEIIISAPRNELDIKETLARYPNLTEFEIPHIVSRREKANVVVFHGQDFNGVREEADGSSSLPFVSRANPASCTSDPPEGRGLESADYNTLAIIGEKPEDMLGDGSSAGDFNLDGSPDILCGAPFADAANGDDVGTTYIVYQRQHNTQVTIELAMANTASTRPPMLRIRGDKAGDRIGWAQESILDLNGDRIDDIALASPYADAGGVLSSGCSLDFNGNGAVDAEDNAAFSACRAQFGSADLFSDNPCAFFDYNNDRRIDDLDAAVVAGGPCPVDNGVVAVVFGGIMLDGDRAVSQIATSQLPGVVFYGAEAGARAGFDIASAGDFNRDGYGDLLITAPGAKRFDNDGRTRVGAVYLIFGGPHLNNHRFSLDLVGSSDLPGIIFVSPYLAGAPDEAPPQYVAGVGDVNLDGFDDIAIGNPLADFVDDTYPQEPDNPGGDLGTGRRRDAGEVYLIYGNNVAENP